MKPKAIQIYEDRAYHLLEKIYTEYENGAIHFVTHNGDEVAPKVFGRSGDGFNVTFFKADSGGR